MNTDSADVSAVAASIVDDAPAPTSSGLPSLTGAMPDNGQTRANENTNGETDSKGVAWDASKHAPNKTKKADGTWRAKTVKAADKGAGAGSGGKPKAHIPGAPPPPPEPLPHLSDAQALTNLFIAGCTGFFGPTWAAPESERAGMVEGTRGTIEAYGGFTMPPWAGMAIAYMMYAAARVHLPETKSRLSRVGDKVAVLWKGVTARFARKVAKPTPPPQNAADAKPAAPVAPGADLIPVDRRLY